MKFVNIHFYLRCFMYINSVSSARLLNTKIMIYYTFCFVLLVFGIPSHAENIQVDIANGPILGQTGYTSGSSKLWYIFQGIPYAEPPVRFELAVEKEPWTEVINCTYDKPQCVQGSNPVLGSEDCLTLSVYSPDIQGSYPVLVWIHGGYFTEGNASYVSQPPDHIVEEGVVFVQIQYRLGVFGFLSTGDLECPGNLGLKDQVLALQWVQANIEYLGGDPTRVTLGGQSAGAASTSLHLQSPKSKGLFHAMILNSGTSLNLWALHRRAVKNARLLAISLCYYYLNSKLLMDCLKRQDYQTLQTASVDVSQVVTLENPLAGIYYGYVPEPDHPDAFFTGKSEQQLSVGNFTKVPLMIGFNSNEALMFGNLSYEIRAYLLSWDLLPNVLPPADLTSNLLKRTAAGIQIKSKFFKYGVVLGDDTDVMTFVSSEQFEIAIFQFASIFSECQSQTFLYEFSYEGLLSGVTYRPIKGVGHAEDLCYFFPKNLSAATAADILTSNRVVRLWCNFVKSHDPTPEDDSLLGNVKWLPMRDGTTGINYLNINDTLVPSTNPKDTYMQFWNNKDTGMYPVYGEPPYDTY